MSLVAELLKNPNTGLESSSGSKSEPPPRTVTEAEKVRTRIFEVASKQRGVTLSFQEAIALRQFIEALEADPFANPNSVLDTLDMQKLDLEVDDNPDHGEDDPFAPEGDEGAVKNNQVSPVGTDRIAVDTAIVAPDATPYHSEPIPASVLASLTSLQSPGQEQPINMATLPPVAAPAPAQAPSGGPTVNGVPIGQTHAPAPAPVAMPPQESRTSRQAPILAESDVPISQIMGNWRKAFKKSKSE